MLRLFAPLIAERLVKITPNYAHFDRCGKCLNYIATSSRLPSGLWSRSRLSSRRLEGSLTLPAVDACDMSSQPQDADRYTARPLGEGDWFVWDRRRNEPVFGMDTLGEHQAHVAARRLSQAYRRAMSPVDIPAQEAAHPDLKPKRQPQPAKAPARWLPGSLPSWRPRP
jgi:hypothetical protein